MQKAVFIARGHVDVTWHSGPRGSATRAHAAYNYILYSYITYSIMGFQPSVDRKGIQPIRSFGSYKPDDFLSFIPCGTNPHGFYNAGDVAR